MDNFVAFGDYNLADTTNTLTPSSRVPPLNQKLISQLDKILSGLVVVRSDPFDSAKWIASSG